MKLFIIGCKGQLGSDMSLCAKAQGVSVECMDYPSIDITNAQSVHDAVTAVSPDVVINCAAHTGVDACETEVDKAYAVNAEGVAHIARASKFVGAKCVHISTDYVFDGLKKEPYVETDIPHPLSVYGKSKLAGEQELTNIYDRHFIVRIAWLYGTRGNNFLKTIRSLAEKRAVAKEPLMVVKDQVGTPTYTMHVCKQILSLINTDHYGLFHGTNEGWCSWYDFAEAIVGAYGIPADLVPCTTFEFSRLAPRSAPRPANSILENEKLKKLGINLMPRWETGLEEYLHDEASSSQNLSTR